MIRECINRLPKDRRGLLFIFVFILISISTITRSILLVQASGEIDFTFRRFFGVYLIGFVYDFANAIYFCFPLVVYLWLMPRNWYSKGWNRLLLYSLSFLIISLLLIYAVAEWFFWDEFNTRFNFIAVDYLVYTTEVIGNIRQSYPIGWISFGIFGIALALLSAIARFIKDTQKDNLSFIRRTKLAVLYSATFLTIFFFLPNQLHHLSSNTYVNELTGNGMYELFAAYRNNELDYDQFYMHLDDRKDFELFHALIKTPEAEFVQNDKLGLTRQITNESPERKLNVVLISVESLSADFMGLFGSKERITPFLDSLAPLSLNFTNLYATGTRTVRGLEALSLCIPPTPGQSIVRRPKNEDLFALAKVFNAKGYKTKFIYGGYGYFDNMSYFFGQNGYQTVDRSALSDEEIDYENIWGVADENLFELALREIEKNVKDQPVFTHIMTTSNHRPYTYPEGRIDIPSHTNRQGAVKYTDYSIGKFIREASKRKWFSRTLFIIVADHCASSAGKTDLPIEKYHIPMLIFSPSNIPPASMDRLMSQIDIGPTVLGLLNFSYKSKFFGYDIFKLEPGRERAFISTYQNLGFIKGHNLVILSPQKKIDFYRLGANFERQAEKPDPDVVNEAVAWYQTASYSFKHGLMK